MLAETERKIVELRKSKLSVRRIAKQVGMSSSAVHGFLQSVSNQSYSYCGKHCKKWKCATCGGENVITPCLVCWLNGVESYRKE